MLVKVKDLIKNFVYKFVPPPYQNVSYSQAGEDCCLSFLFSQLNILQPNYLEFGVCHPFRGSNSYRFYKHGGRGVLVEADVTQIELIKNIALKTWSSMLELHRVIN